MANDLWSDLDAWNREHGPGGMLGIKLAAVIATARDLSVRVANQAQTIDTLRRERDAWAEHADARDPNREVR